tara:strand:+ start:453 stop:725 length:273 start_codon:yes stop_codon:yes gene_type:complete
MYLDNPHGTILQMISLNFRKEMTVIDTLEDLKGKFQKSEIQNEFGMKRIQEFIDYLEERHTREELDYKNAVIQNALFSCLELQSEILKLK